VPLPIRAKALRYAAVLASAQGDVAHALRWNQESLVAHTAIGDRSGTAYTLAALGDVQVSHNLDSEQGYALMKESLSMARMTNDTWVLARVTWRMGMARYHTGSDVEHGRMLLTESLTLSRSIGDRWGMSNVLPHVAKIVWTQGDERRAITLLEEALSLARILGNQRSIATSLNMLGSIARGQHDYVRARSCHEESLRVAQTAHLSFPHAGAIYFLGRVALCQELYAEAQTRFLQSIQQYHTLHATRHMVEPLVLLAVAHHRMAQMEETTRLLAMITRLLYEFAIDLPDLHQQNYQQMIASTQSALEPSAWSRAWEVGQHLSVDHLLQMFCHCDGYAATTPGQSLGAQPRSIAAGA